MKYIVRMPDVSAQSLQAGWYYVNRSGRIYWTLKAVLKSDLGNRTIETGRVIVPHFTEQDPSLAPMGIISSVSPWTQEMIEVIDPSGTDPTHDIVTFTVKNDNSPFVPRRNKGEILLAPYDKSHYSFVQKPGGTKVSKIEDNTLNVLCDFGQLMADSGWPTRTFEGRLCADTPFPGADNDISWCYGQAAVRYSDYVVETGSDMPVFPRNALAQYYQDLADNARDNYLVTKTLADANRGMMDILTNLAELPESIKYLIDLVKRASNVCIFFKQKELRVFKEKNKPLELIKWGTMPEKQRLKENRKRKKQRNADLLSVPDAIAQVRVEFAYAISPILQAIKDTLKSIKAIGRQYASFKNLSQQDFEPFLPSGWVIDSHSGSFDLRCFIKRAYESNDFIQALYEIGGTSVLNTLLERTPVWGIVVNYITNLGDYLTANSVGVYSQQDWTFSGQIQVSTVYKHVVTGSLVNVIGYSYGRNTPFNIQNCTTFGARWKDSLDAHLNVFAMLWLTLRGQLRSGNKIPVGLTR